MRSSGRRSRGGRRPAAEGTAPGRWAARGASEGAGLGAGRSGLTMEGARGRGAEGRGRGPGAGRAAEGQAGDAGGGGEAGGCRAVAGRHERREPPAGAEEGSGPGTPLRFPFRGARCRRALRCPREMAAPPPPAWAVPASRFAREKYIYNNNGNKKEKRDKSKAAATKERAAAGARRRAKRVRGAAGGTGPASAARSPRLRAPRCQLHPPPKSRPWVSFPAFPRGGALRSCPLCSSQQWPKGIEPPKGQMSLPLQEFPVADCSGGSHRGRDFGPVTAGV